jgi:hypothetical protein
MFEQQNSIYCLKKGAECEIGVRDGFDISIGNPPYVRADEQSA